MKYAIRGFLAAAVVLFLTSASAFAQADPAGTWELQIASPTGADIVTLSLTPTGDKLAGTLSGQAGSTPIEGTFKDADWVLIANTDGQKDPSKQIKFDGHLDGDAVNGVAKFGMDGALGEFKYTGKRVMAASANASGSPTPTVDVAGKWEILLSIPGAGEFPVTATLKQDGEKITGLFSSPAGDAVVAGAMTGSSLKLEFTVDSPAGLVPVTMTGDLLADAFSGKADIGGMTQADWKATRGK